MTDKELIAALELLADQSEGISHRAMLVARAARRLEELAARNELAEELERRIPILEIQLADLEEAKNVSQAAMRMEFGADFDPVAWLKQYGELQAASQNKIRLVGEFCQVVLNEAADAMAEEIARKKK